MAEGFIGLPEIDGQWLSNPKKFLTIMKNTNTEAVLKIIGAGSLSFDATNLLKRVSKKINFVNGSNIIYMSQGYDSVGIAIGGKVTNGDLTIAEAVTKIEGRRITINNPISLATQDNYSVEFDSQVLIDPRMDISKIYFSTGIGSSIEIYRGVDLVLSLRGTDFWDLDNLYINQNNDTPIQFVTHDAISTMLLEIKKTGNWGNDNLSYGSV